MVSSKNRGRGLVSDLAVRTALAVVATTLAASQSPRAEAAARAEEEPTITESSSDFSAAETNLETFLDVALGVAFLGLAFLAGKRMYVSRRATRAATVGAPTNGGGGGRGGTGGQQQQQAETAVVTAFYSLILVTSGLRSLYFLIPSGWWQPSYTPVAVFAFDPAKRYWIGAALSELLVTGGSLCLFSIFILILVYWADILKKYFHPGSRRSLPMVTFLILVATLFGLEVINIVCFLLRLYTTEGMILFNASLLAVVSTVCVVEITIFSHRFRTVLKTLGAINQVSTDSQVRRIVWITVTGNLFFVTRALLELVFAATLVFYWTQHGTVAKAFRHKYWDVYISVKYWSEVTILALMLYILQSRFASSGGASTSSTSASAAGASRGGYQKVPDAEPQSRV
jgi:hypothetical protein